MATGNNHDDDNDDDNKNNDRRDLTRLEDLSEFFHQEDPELAETFDNFNQKKTVPPPVDEAPHFSFDVPAEDPIDNLTPTASDDLPPDFLGHSEPSEPVNEAITFNSLYDAAETAEEAEEEVTIEKSEAQQDLQDNFEETNDPLFEFSSDPDQNRDPLEETEFKAETDLDSELTSEEPYPNAFSEEAYPEISPPIVRENLDDLTNFAQNFSYGKIEAGGNPPFSIIIRNLKYESDAEDIISTLREFGLVTDQNLDETKQSLERDSLLIPQISEYSAIILAHKFRRYDCDLEVGLSDEIHPSKSGEVNPRGLIKKTDLQQNKMESFKKDENDALVTDIIVSTTATLEGYVIKKYIGVQTSFTIVDEEELERLKFVQKMERMNTPLHNYETEEPISSERAFKDYQISFDLLFTDLSDQLKVKAIKEKANALLGLNYQLQPLPLEKSSQKRNCYQLTCSATLAIVRANDI